MESIFIAVSTVQMHRYFIPTLGSVYEDRHYTVSMKTAVIELCFEVGMYFFVV